MIRHVDIHASILRRMIRRGEMMYAGNRQLKIYGTLRCKSGKRMKKENRVFFVSKEEAMLKGYRPCGHCLRREYRHWKQG